MGQIIPAFSRETREAIHAHGVRSDPRRYGPPTGCSHFFQSTIPEWGATRKAIQGTMRAIISIHAPRVGSDKIPCEILLRYQEFLSTLPAWGATQVAGRSRQIHHHFYPRSPRGERLLSRVPGREAKNFYPRSPRGERPHRWSSQAPALIFLSTLPAWGAT